MLRRRQFSAGTVLISLSATLAAGDEAVPPTPDLSERVAALVKRLDADEFDVREAAAAEAGKLPPAVIPLLEAELRKPGVSAELRVRLETALRDVRSTRRRAIVAAEQKKFAAWIRTSLVGA